MGCKKVVKDKDKLWIVYNVNIAGMTVEAANVVSEHVHKILSQFDDSVMSLIVPIREGNSHIEFYNLEKAEPTTIEKLKELMKYAEPEAV
jgi:hypothetical protein